MEHQKRMILEVLGQPTLSVKARNANGNSSTRRFLRYGLIITLALFVVSLFASQPPVYAQDQPVSPLGSDTITLPAQRNSIFLPLVTYKTGVVASSCNLNDFESAIMNMMRENSRQKRETLICNPTLAKVARARAADMAARGYFSHVNPDGQGPNYLVAIAGFRLPTWYSSAQNANNLESIAAGYKSPADVWTAWMKSSSHEKHVLGLDKFYADQVEVGIGYVSLPESKHNHYWVVITAPRE